MQSFAIDACLDEGVLYDVLRTRRVAGHAQAELVDAAMVAFEQRAEAGLVARGHPFDQLFVGNCVHDVFRFCYR